MAEVSVEFSNRSGGIVKGAIGSLDGWVVHILLLGWRDMSRHPISNFLRKEFYALNNHCIVDEKKSNLGILLT